MAKVKFGMIVTEMRNKLGGHVFSKNHYGAFSRTLVSPLYVNNDYTQAQREPVATLSVMWSTLTDVERAAWQAVAEATPFTDIFGDTYFLTGFNYFMRINRNLLQVGSASVTSPPAATHPEPFGSFSVDVDLEANLFEITPATPPADTNSVIELFTTLPMSYGINYVSTRFRLTAIQPIDGSASYDFFAEYMAKWGSPAVVGRYWVKLRTIENTSGLPSIWWQSYFDLV